MKSTLLLSGFFLAAGFLLAAPGTAVLTDDVYQLQPGDWRWVRFEIRRQPATAECHFEATSGSEVHAELIARPDLELLRQRKHHEALATSDTGRMGVVSQYIQDPGEYAAVIENTGSQPVQVHLNVALTFGIARPVSRYLSSTRRLTVILVSSAMFFAIVTFSARALLRAMKVGRGSAGPG
jgi:hypothetical protein